MPIFTSSRVQSVDECLPLCILSFSIDKRKMKRLSAEGLHFSVPVAVGVPNGITVYGRSSTDILYTIGRISWVIFCLVSHFMSKCTFWYQTMTITTLKCSPYKYNMFIQQTEEVDHSDLGYHCQSGWTNLCL